MKRILIVGCSGSGKSTLAKQLGNFFQLEIIHLDAHYWHPGWRESNKEEWKIKVGELITGDRWIMDGNYSGTLDLRASRADTIIFLDFSRCLCLKGIFRRWLHYYGRTRPDLPPGCPEQMDLEFFLYVWNYRKSRRPKMLRMLAEYQQQEKAVHIFTTRKQMESWRESLSE